MVVILPGYREVGFEMTDRSIVIFFGLFREENNEEQLGLFVRDSGWEAEVKMGGEKTAELQRTRRNAEM
jgi:hypothetical protein